MIDSLLAIVAPHHCSGCGQEGFLLCHNCKYDIIMEDTSMCLVCGRLSGVTGICSECKPSYSRAWCVGMRTASLERIINSYKFYNTKSASITLADLLDATLSELPSNVVLVPVPTIKNHIRQRGYDHTLLICRRLASLRQLPVDRSLSRITNTKQRDASRSQRIKQAKVAFACRERLDENKIYLIIDDVVTTGATLEYSAKTLLLAGAKTVWVAAIARQPLD